MKKNKKLVTAITVSGVIFSATSMVSGCVYGSPEADAGSLLTPTTVTTEELADLGLTTTEDIAIDEIADTQIADASDIAE